MKTTFIQLGILVIIISNTAFANNLTKPSLNSEPDTIITSSVSYKKTIEEIIKEDNQIIESNQTNVLYDSVPDTLVRGFERYKKTIEEVIKEDNLIIESNITNEVFPLDLAKLNIATAKEHTSKHHNSFSDSNALKS